MTIRTSQETVLFNDLSPVRVVATNNITGVYKNGLFNNGVGATIKTSSGTLKIDDVDLNAGDRVLFQNQDSALENGIYVVEFDGVLILKRSFDQQSISQLKAGQFVSVGAGTVHSGEVFCLVEPIPAVIGVSSFVYQSSTNGTFSGVTPQQVQRFVFNTVAATGTSDAISVDLTPAVTTLTNNLLVTFTTTNTNLTTSPTISVNGLTAVPVVLAGGDSVVPGDIQPGTSYIAIYNVADNRFQLVNPTFSTANTFFTQSNEYNYAVDSGAANAYIVTLNPAPANTIGGGFPILMSVTHTNTGASSIVVNGLGSIPIVGSDGSALVGGELTPNAVAYMIYNNTLGAFVLQNSALGIPGGVTPQEVQQSAFNFGIDSGTADAYIVNLSPAVTSLTDGLLVGFTPTHSNLTTTPTLQINGMAAKQIWLINSDNPMPDDLDTGYVAYLQYSLAADLFILLTPLQSSIYRSEIQYNSAIAGTDSGAANAYAMGLAPTTGQVYAQGRFFVLESVAHSNTTASTLAVNGHVFTITTPDNAALVGGEILVTQTYLFFMTQPTQAVLLNSSLAEVVGVTSITGTADEIIASSSTGSVTLSLPQAIATTSSPTFAQVSAGTLVTGYATTATAVATTTLTAASHQQQYFTGATTQTVLLPVTSTLALGQTYTIVNNSTGVVTVESSGGNVIQAMAAGTSLVATVISTSGTTAASWSYVYSPLVPSSDVDVTSAQVQQAAFNVSTDTGAADAYAVALTPAAGSYTNGLQVSFTPTHANLTTTPTLAINGLGAITIKLSNGALAAGDLTTGMIAELVYSTAANAFILQSPVVSNPAIIDIENQPWTPTFSFTVPGNLSVVYNTQAGLYSKIGNVVTCSFFINCNPTFTTSAGSVYIGGFPFVPNGTGGPHTGAVDVAGPTTYPTGCTYLVGEMPGFGLTNNMIINACGFGTLVGAAIGIHELTSTLTFQIKASITYQV